MRPSPTLENAVAPGVRVKHIEPIQTRIARNRWRFVGFMLLFTGGVGAGVALSALLAAIIFGLFFIGQFRWWEGLTLGGFLGAVTLGTFAAGVLGAWVWALSQLFRSETVLIRRLGAQMPKAGTLLQTKSVLRDIAIAAGLPSTPQFYVIDTPKVNAFVLGRSPKRVRVGVTRGMLERICIDEQRAVFANLVARVLSGDTLWATAVSSVMGPIWAFRDNDLRRSGDRDARAFEAASAVAPGARRANEAAFGALIATGALIVVTEFSSWYHREAAWRAAEKADAEGMMLLKDPRSMLRAIENVLERDNHVPTAGDAYSQLFYCWAGYGFAAEDDPEMRRVARLRETLGAEGAPYIPRPNVPGWPTAPVAPRIELAEEIAAGEPDAGQIVDV